MAAHCAGLLALAAAPVGRGAPLHHALLRFRGTAPTCARGWSSSSYSGGGGGGEREFVHGVHPCAAVLRFAGAPGGREIRRVYVARSEAAPERGLQAVLDEVGRRGLRVTYTDRSSLNGLVKQAVNQGIAFEVSALAPRRLEEPPPLPPPGAPPPLLVALDELQDVHNVGAIARSAFLLGADGIVSGVRSAAPLNGTVSKVSSGALEHLAGAGAVYVTQSLPALLGACREAGWRVIGAAAPPAAGGGGGGSGGGRAPPTVEDESAGGGGSGDGGGPPPAPPSQQQQQQQQQPQWIASPDLRRDAPTVLVLGGEAKGLRTNVRRQCTGFAYVPMRPDDGGAGGGLGAVDSLNVAAAAAILLHALAPPRGQLR